MTNLLRQGVYVFLLLLTLTACRSAPPAQPYAAEQSFMLLEQGVESHQQGRYPEALFLFKEAANHFRSIDNQTKLLLALLNLAETADLIGQQDLAYTTAHTAKDLANATAQPNQYLRAKLLLARIQYERGNVPHALKYANELIADIPPTQTALTFNALVLRAELELETEPTSQQWLAALRQLKLNHPLYQARTLRVEAAYLLATQLAEAKAKQEQALFIYQQAAYRPGTAAALAELAHTYTLQDDFAEAEDAIRRALYIRVWLNDSRRTGLLLAQLANTLERQEKHSKAARARNLAGKLEAQPTLIRSSGFLKSLENENSRHGS